MDDNAKHLAATVPPPTPAGWASGGFGAGLVLVVLPTAALVLGSHWFATNAIVGLPVVAVLGIVILFGTLALVSTLFARLGLDDQAEALALPSGSIRAFIALALIVLFALIAVMLFESLGDTIEVKGLTEEQKVALVKEPTNHVTALVPTACTATTAAAPASASACTPGSMVYTAHVLRLLDADAAALSKQLLTLVGTLMTSAVSFYFASRATEATTKNVIAAMTPPDKSGGDPSTGGADAANRPAVPGPGGDDHVDGCHVPVVNPTADQDLPPSRGGVTS